MSLRLPIEAVQRAQTYKPKKGEIAVSNEMMTRSTEVAFSLVGLYIAWKRNWERVPMILLFGLGARFFAEVKFQENKKTVLRWT